MRRILVMFILIIFIVGCSSKEHKTIDHLKRAMNEANVNYNEILHSEIVEDGVLVFYENNMGLNAGFLKRTGNKWEWIIGGGSPALKPEKSLSWHVSNYPNIPLFFSYGEIANPNIVKVMTTSDNWKVEETAKIITTTSGVKIWFAIYDEPIEPIFDIIGLSKDNKVLYTEWNHQGRGQREWLIKHGYIE